MYKPSGLEIFPKRNCRLRHPTPSSCSQSASFGGSSGRDLSGVCRSWCPWNRALTSPSSSIRYRSGLGSHRCSYCQQPRGSRSDLHHRCHSRYLSIHIPCNHRLRHCICHGTGRCLSRSSWCAHTDRSTSNDKSGRCGIHIAARCRGRELPRARLRE